MYKAGVEVGVDTEAAIKDREASERAERTGRAGVCDIRGVGVEAERFLGSMGSFRGETESCSVFLAVAVEVGAVLIATGGVKMALSFSRVDLVREGGGDMPVLRVLPVAAGVPMDFTGTGSTGTEACIEALFPLLTPELTDLLAA